MASMRSVLVALALACAACVPAGGPDGGGGGGPIVPPGPLTGDQIVRLVSGNTLSGTTGGAAWSEYHAPDGTLFGRSATSGDYAARWYVRGDTLCFDYPGQSQDDCWTVRTTTSPVQLTNTVYLTSVTTGRPLDPLTLRPGNPDRLGGGIVPSGGQAQALVGNTVSGISGTTRWSEYHAPDGTVRGFDTVRGDYSGRYFLQLDQICYDYFGTMPGGCWRVRVAGNQVYATNVDTGAQLGPLTLRQGNPLGL